MQGAPAFWTVPAQSRSKCLLLSWMKPRMMWCGSPARLTQGQMFQLNTAKTWITSELFNCSKTKFGGWLSISRSYELAKNVEASDIHSGATIATCATCRIKAELQSLGCDGSLVGRFWGSHFHRLAQSRDGGMWSVFESSRNGNHFWHDLYVEGP